MRVASLLRVPLLVALLALAAPLAPAAGVKPVVTARVVRGFVLDGKLDEWKGAERLVLSKANLILPEQSTLSHDWAGDADLSGVFHVGFTATSLVIAGRVRDDQPRSNPTKWWLGDEVEVFLGIYRGPDRDDPPKYGPGDYQLLLFPLEPGRKWGFTRAGRHEQEQSDGGFDGVRVSGERLPEDDRDAPGYTFEAEIPFVNFPGFAPRKNLQIAFDLALVDVDAEFPRGQKSYMTWSRQENLANFPNRFGRLEFGEDPPAPASAEHEGGGGILTPLVILLGVIFVLFVLWRFRQRLSPLAELPIRTKLLLLAPLLVLLLLAKLVPAFVVDRKLGGAARGLEQRARTIEGVLAEARQEGLLDPKSEREHILELLEGGTVIPEDQYRFRPLFLSPPRVSETLSGIPVIRYARSLVGEEEAVFRRSEPVRAAAATAVVHLAPGRPLPGGAVIGEVRVVLGGGRPVVTRELRFEREVDDFRVDGSDDPASEAEIAWRNLEAGTHANQVTIPIDPPGDVERVEVEQQVFDGSLVVHGVSLTPPGDGSPGNGPPLPLPMISRTLIGVETNLWEDGPDGVAVTLGPGSEPLRVPLVGEADRVWVLYTMPPGLYGPDTRNEGREMARLRLVGADGIGGEPFALRLGEHLVGEILHANKPPPGFVADIALKWSAPGGWARHRAAVALSTEGLASPVTLVAEYVADEESLQISGVTQGRRIAHAPADRLEYLALVPGENGYELRSEVRDELAGLTYRWIGRLARHPLPARAPELRRIKGEPHVTTLVETGTSGAGRLEAARPAPPTEGVQEAGRITVYSILGLLLLGVLLVLADLLSRLPRIRAKLTLGFAVAALVPLLLFFFGLSGVLEREIGRTEEGTLGEQLRQIRTKVDEFREELRSRAQELLRRERLDDTRHSPDFRMYSLETDEAVKSLSETASPLGGSAELYLTDDFPIEGGPPIRFFSSVPARVAWLHEPTNDLVYRWSELVVEGYATRILEEGQRVLGIAVPIDESFLSALKDRFGERTQVLIYTLRGYPVVGTIEITGELDLARSRERAGVAARVDVGSPFFRKELLAGVPYFVGYDLLRRADGEPVALLGVALPRREFIAARAEIRNLFLVLGAVILVLEVIIGSVLTRRLTDPLTSLTAGARNVTEGNLNTRVNIPGGDEIGDLADHFNRMTAQLGHRIDELSKLNAAVGAFSGSLDRGLVLEKAVEAFRKSGSRPDGLVLAFGDEEEVEILAGFRGDRAIVPAFGPAGEGLLGRALLEKEPAVFTDLGADTSPAPFEGEAIGRPRSAVAVPFDTGRESRGLVLLLYDRPDPGIMMSDLEFLSTMAQQVGIAVENARLYQLAIEDEGTDLYVPTYFQARLREETDRAIAAGRPLSVLLVSIDEIAQVYETYGTEDGDHSLNRAVRRLRSTLSRHHIMARAGRDTIEIMLPEAGKEEALGVAQAIRSELGRMAIRLKGDPEREIHLSPSIGLATCPDDAASAEFLMAEAHQALFKAVNDQRGTRLVDVGPERRRSEMRVRVKGGMFVFRSEEMIEIVETIDRIAASDVPILVQGETGVGKEVLAEIAHEKSKRRDKALIRVNCAALPDTLLESELFGYERGAFTGADRRKPGRFELAHGGTIFLDEIGEIPPQTQVKLLRVLQDHQVERLGGTAPIHVDVRVVAATNADLAAAIRSGRFREDLFFRLNVFSLVIPPLRARKEEIPDLVEHFLGAYLAEHEVTARRLSPAAMDKLFSHSWPGNVRELRNTIERALVIARTEEVRPDDIVFPEPPQNVPAPVAPRAGGRSSRPSRAAAAPAEDAIRTLNARQRKLLDILAHRSSITNREYADLVGVSSRTGNRDLGELIRLGLIEQMGRRRAAVYRLAR